MSQRDWRPFPQARAFVRTLTLLDQSEWLAYSRGDLRELRGERPEDIPSNPNSVYRDEGWCGIRDWLGPAPLQPVEPGYMEFRRARSFAQSLGLATAHQWQRWCAGQLPDRPPRPANIPEDPPAMYPRAWRGWAEWLGSHRPPRRCRSRPFEEARTFVRGLVLVSAREWRDYCCGRLEGHDTKPEDIPADPGRAYRHSGWKGYSDWLGTETVSVICSPFLPFEEARTYVRSLGLSSCAEWREWIRGELPGFPDRPRMVPRSPDQAFADTGWGGWGDFLGSGRIACRERTYRSFASARRFARRLKLRTKAEWGEFSRGERPDLGDRPADVPSCPNQAYASRGWTDWGDFLGTGNVAPKARAFASFADARNFVRSLRLPSRTEWRAWRTGERPDLPPPPDDIPATPDRTYADCGWAGWPDFFGTARTWMSFEEARRFSRGLGVGSVTGWWDWMRGDRPDLPAVPKDLPRSPNYVYARKGWRGWRDFLRPAETTP